MQQWLAPLYALYHSCGTIYMQMMRQSYESGLASARTVDVVVTSEQKSSKKPLVAMACVAVRMAGAALARITAQLHWAVRAGAHLLTKRNRSGLTSRSSEIQSTKKVWSMMMITRTIADTTDTMMIPSIVTIVITIRTTTTLMTSITTGMTRTLTTTLMSSMRLSIIQSKIQSLRLNTMERGTGSTPSRTKMQKTRASSLLGCTRSTTWERAITCRCRMVGHEAVLRVACRPSGEHACGSLRPPAMLVPCITHVASYHVASKSRRSGIEVQCVSCNQCVVVHQHSWLVVSSRIALQRNSTFSGSGFVSANVKDSSWLYENKGEAPMLHQSMPP
mmetsp:Transcript_15229/g.25437  ORF Transcript_15229/g.25437 Transcript_15229/m.25437 type:complete len:333 (-) Transcript_15229:237-1235(-)